MSSMDFIMGSFGTLLKKTPSFYVLRELLKRESLAISGKYLL